MITIKVWHYRWLVGVTGI